MIESQQSKVVYKISESPVFNFPYKIFSPEDIQVFWTENETDLSMSGNVQLTKGKDYTVENAADYSCGANIVLSDAFMQKKGSFISILRNTPFTQSTALPERGKLPSEALEAQLDKIVMMAQQLKEEVSRCVKVSFTSPETANRYFDEILLACEGAANSAEAAAEAAKRAEEVFEEINNSGAAENSVSLHNISPVAHDGYLLNLNGGTMRGMMRSEVADFFFRTVSDSHICFCGSKSFDEGASLFLLGQDVKSQWDTPGMFKIRAKAKDANGNPVDAIFLGTPDGFMSFKGRPVTFSVDGVGAEGDGNIQLNALPKSGGQMTTIMAMSRNVDDSFLGLCGGTGKNGAELFLCGASNPDLPSVFQLIARTSDGVVTLQGSPDSQLTWGGKDITLGYPDYSRGVDVTHEQIVNIYVAPEDGWFSCEINNGGQLFINDNWVSGGYYDMNVMVPVKAGDKIYGTNRTSGNTFGCRFFPIKRGV